MNFLPRVLGMHQPVNGRQKLLQDYGKQVGLSGVVIKTVSCVFVLFLFANVTNFFNLFNL